MIGWVVTKTNAQGVKRYLVRFREGGRGTRQRSKTFTRAKDARRWLNRNVHAVQSGTYKPLAPITFAAYTKQWLATTQELKPSTRAAYTSLLHARLTPFFGTGLLHMISAEDINRFLSSVADELSPKSRRNLLMLLSKILEDARENGHTAMNPLRHTKAVRRPRVDKQRPDILNLEEVNRVLEEIEPHYQPLILTLALTGMRLGEAVGLEWRDIDPVRRVIRVERAVWKGRTLTPKTRGSRRAIDVADQLLGALQALRRDLPPARRADHARVFLTPAGTAIDGDNLRHRVWEPALQRAKVRRVVLHSLRHTFASQLIALGEDVKYVQAQLGHASATLTLETYSHLWPNASRRTAARLEALLADAKTAKSGEHRVSTPGTTGPDGAERS